MNKNSYRISVIGTGFVATAFLAALKNHPRLTVAGVLTRRDPKTLGHLPVSPTRITNSIEDLIPRSDLFVEMSGDPVYATPLIEKIFTAGLPVVTLDCDLQVLTGSALAKKGTLVEAEGDQPGSLAALDADVRAMGFSPLVYGNVKGFLNVNPAQEEMQKWADKQGLSLAQTTAFTDGTKVQMEMALVANGLGATLAKRGMSGVHCENLRDGALELARTADALGAPIADYIITKDAPGAVFIVAKHGDEHRARLEYFKLGPGPYYVLTRQFHLGPFEVAKTVINVLESPGRYVFNNGPRPAYQVIAVAKRDIAAGEVIGRGSGGFDVRGEVVKIAECPDAVPIGLMSGAKARTPIRAGETLVFDGVELQPSRALEIYKEMLYNSNTLMPQRKQKLTLTVGIPTYYGGPSLVRAAESIMASRGVSKFRLIVRVDGNPLKPEIETRLKELGVEVHFSPKRGGQVAGLNDIICMADTDVLVLAQDDVVFESDALQKLLGAFERDPRLTMANANVMPTRAETYFERVQEIGQHVVKRIIRFWRGSDNYLSANGRCHAFRTSWIKQITIPGTLVNSDAYLYFENKFRGGAFAYVPDAVVYDRSPLKLAEYVRQSKKYQISARELTKYFPSDLTTEYRVPFGAKALAYFGELVRHPILAVFYLILFIYGRLTPNPTGLSHFWETDVSTKR